MRSYAVFNQKLLNPREQVDGHPALQRRDKILIQAKSEAIHRLSK
jgi:hypothetical protein